MNETVIEEKAATARDDLWTKRIAEHGRSGLSVKQFCKERGLSEYCFYTWRKRLRHKESEPVRFALLETGAGRQEPAAGLELVLTTGERLRIGKGVDAETLRTVLETVRR